MKSAITHATGAISTIEPLLSELKNVAAAAKKLSMICSCSDSPADLAAYTDPVCEALERAAVTSRNTLEKIWNEKATPTAAPVLPYMSISGTVKVIAYNWLYIKLNSLLPHCRFQTPQYIGDTIIRLLDNYAAEAGSIPRHEHALLIIDEHCNIRQRTVYDQDNKGWKAVSNALKGRIFPDDDQFSLDIALVSEQSDEMSCNIFVIDAADAGEFFNMRSSGMLYW